MPSGMGGHHMSLGNPMALGQLGHPVAAMGQQMSQTTAYPSLLPQFQQFPQHQMTSGQLAVQPGVPFRPHQGQQHPLLQQTGQVGGSKSPSSLGSDSYRSDSEVEDAEEEELGPMFTSRSKPLPLNPLQQQTAKLPSRAEELEDDDDEIEAIGDNEEEEEEVMHESNTDEPADTHSGREEVMTFEEDSKDVQEAEEEVPTVSAEAEEMLEGREEQVEEGGEEDVKGKPEEGGDYEASAEELQ